MKKANYNQDDIIDLHNEAAGLFKIPIDKRTPKQCARLEEIVNIVSRIENEKYEEPYHRYSPPQQQEGRELTDEWMKDMQRQALESFQNVINGGPNSFRVIAKFGPSNYDITITKLDEVNVIQVLLNKFINALNEKRQPNKLF